MRIGNGVKSAWLKNFMKKFAMPHIFNMTNTQNMTVAHGLQAHFLINAAHTPLSNDWWLPSWNLTQQFHNTQTGSGAALVIGTPASNDRLVMNYIKVKSMLRNMGTDKVKMTLYDVVPRHDTLQTALYPIDPTVAWDQGFADENLQAATGSTAASAAIVGSTPFGSEKFTELYRVLKVTKLSIEPGGEHTHTVTIRPGRIFKRYTDQEYVMWKGLSWACMAVLYGDVVKDSGGTGAVSTGKGEVSVVTTTRCEFTTITKLQTTVTTYDNLPGDATFVTPQIVDRAGQIIAEAQI